MEKDRYYVIKRIFQFYLADSRDSRARSPKAFLDVRVFFQFYLAYSEPVMPNVFKVVLFSFQFYFVDSIIMSRIPGSWLKVYFQFYFVDSGYGDVSFSVID
jgi:hypothetical protein